MIALAVAILFLFSESKGFNEKNKIDISHFGLGSFLWQQLSFTRSLPGKLWVSTEKSLKKKKTTPGCHQGHPTHEPTSACFSRRYPHRGSQSTVSWAAGRRTTETRQTVKWSLKGSRRGDQINKKLRNLRSKVKNRSSLADTVLNVVFRIPNRWRCRAQNQNKSLYPLTSI